jgi:hypothetical protein
MSSLGKKEEQVLNRKITKFTWIFLLALFFIIGVLIVVTGDGDVTVHVNEDKLEIEGSYWFDKSINYEEIQQATYTEDFNVGNRRNGFGSFKLQEGHFKNSQFGKYILYSYVKCKSYIVIKTDSEMVVINEKNSEDTKKLYEEISQRINK